MLGLLQSRVVVIPEVFRGFRYTEMLEGLRRDVPEVEHVFVARGEPAAGMQAWATLTDTAWESREGRRPLPGGDPNHVHEVVFTSGTTGEPKGVMHTPNTTLSTIYSVIDRLGFSERDVILMASTLGHQTGYLYSYCLKHRHPARGARGRQEARALAVQGARASHRGAGRGGAARRLSRLGGLGLHDRSDGVPGRWPDHRVVTVREPVLD